MGHCHKRETDVSDFSECEVTNISLQFKTFFPYFLYAFYIFKTYTGVRRSTKLRKFFAETSKKVVFLRYFLLCRHRKKYEGRKFSRRKDANLY